MTLILNMIIILFLGKTMSICLSVYLSIHPSLSLIYRYISRGRFIIAGSVTVLRPNFYTSFFIALQMCRCEMIKAFYSILYDVCLSIILSVCQLSSGVSLFLVSQLSADLITIAVVHEGSEETTNNIRTREWKADRAARALLMTRPAAFISYYVGTERGAFNVWNLSVGWSCI